MSRRAAVALALLAVHTAGAACKDKGSSKRVDDGASPTGSGSAAIVSNAWGTCEAALRAAPTLPATRRADAIIAGCRPCGDWTPILTWQQLPEKGGPTRTQIEDAMLGCKAYCEPNAKMRFLGTLDDARMKGTRTPWRELGEMCREQVSAVPDARYMSASYFALDRIARDVAARPGGPELLAPIELPLAPVSVSAVGVTIPDAPLSKPELMRVGITVTQGEISVGSLPVARLGANGVTVAGDPYPGRIVTQKELPDAIAKLGGKAAIFAPSKMPASRLAEVVAGGWGDTVYLAVTAQTGPYGIVPVALRSPAGPKAGIRLALGASPDEAIKVAKTAGPDTLKASTITIEIDRAATVASLATLIGALAFYEVPAVALEGP